MKGPQRIGINITLLAFLFNWNFHPTFSTAVHPAYWPMQNEFPFLGNYRNKTNVSDAEVDDSCTYPVYLGFLNQMVKAILAGNKGKVESIRELIETLAQNSSKFAKSICYTSGGSPILECKKLTPIYLDYPTPDSADAPRTDIIKKSEKKAGSGPKHQCRCLNSLNFRTIYDENTQSCLAERGSVCNDVISTCQHPDDRCIGVQDEKTGEFCTCQTTTAFEASAVKPGTCTGRLSEASTNAGPLSRHPLQLSVLLPALPAFLLLHTSPTPALH